MWFIKPINTLDGQIAELYVEASGICSKHYGLNS
jgi:hypothetical protein